MKNLFQDFVLIYGPPGSGKTSLALYAASQIGQRILYIGFYETENKVKLKISSLGLDSSRYIVLDYASISDTDILFSNVVEKFYEYSPDVVILDGINALPQSREAASLLYRVFQTPTIAIGEEHLGASHFAYVADTLLEVGQFFHREARYRKIRVIKTRLTPPQGTELYFTITNRGVRIIERWSKSKLGNKTVASPSGRKVVLSSDLIKSLTKIRGEIKRPGLVAGSRVAAFICNKPTCLRLSAAYLCDYLETTKVAVFSIYPYIGYVAKQMGCEVEEVVMPASKLGEDYVLEESLSKVGEASVVSVYGLEEVYYTYGPERVAYILDYIHSALPESALLATFMGMEPVVELLTLFNTVWRYLPDRAEIVQSAYGWPVRYLKIREEEGVFYLS